MIINMTLRFNGRNHPQPPGLHSGASSLLPVREGRPVITLVLLISTVHVVNGLSGSHAVIASYLNKEMSYRDPKLPGRFKLEIGIPGHFFHFH